MKEKVIIVPEPRSNDQFVYGIKVLMARNYSLNLHRRHIVNGPVMPGNWQSAPFSKARHNQRFAFSLSGEDALLCRTMCQSFLKPFLKGLGPDLGFGRDPARRAVLATVGGAGGIGTRIA